MFVHDVNFSNFDIALGDTRLPQLMGMRNLSMQLSRNLGWTC